MKILSLLFVLFIVCSLGKIVKINKNSGRTSSPESVDFQLIYLGSCSEFNAIQNTVRVSILSSPCLPISSASPDHLDNDELTAHVLCTNIGPGRAQIDFVEIFQVVDDDFPGSNFAISFRPNRPFRAFSAGVKYLRRPSCTTNRDYCSANSYVHQCTEHEAIVRNGWVVSDELVYIIPPQQNAVGCSNAVNTCCAYLNAPSSTFCPRAATHATLNFDWGHYGNDHDDHHDHDDNHGHGGNGGHNDDHYDDHDDHDDNHGHGGHGGPGGPGGNGGHGGPGGPGGHGGHVGHGGPGIAKVAVQEEEEDKKKK